MSEHGELSQKVLAACRILAHRNLVEAFGHFSARIPGTDTFLITPRRSLSQVTRPEHLVVVNFAGDAISDAPEPPLELYIHACLYRTRADIGAIARTHSFNASVLGALGMSVGVVHDFGAILLGEVRTFPFSDLIENNELGVKLAEFMGTSAGTLLRGNGTVIAGRDPIEACIRAVYLEESALIQRRAMQLGEPRFFTPEEIEARGRQLLEPSHLLRAWDHYCLEAGAL